MSAFACSARFLRRVNPPELRRDRARQLVLTKVQDRQVGQPAQLEWDPARQAVREEGQCPQVGEVTQFGRDGARKVVRAKV